MSNTAIEINNDCPKHNTGGGPCYCQGSLNYEMAKRAEDERERVLRVIAKEYPEAGELFIKEVKTRMGTKKQVRGKGTDQHKTSKQGVYLCTVGSVLWDCYAAEGE